MSFASVTEQALAELAEAHRQTEQCVSELAELQKQAIRQHDRWLSDTLELNYREKISAYLGPILRKVRMVPLQDIVDDLERHLSTEELDELWPLDLLVRGQATHLPERPEIWLAMEVSYVIDRHDVTRAGHRAALLRKAGYRAIPTVAGQEITEGAEAEISREKVFLLRNGGRRFWEEAVAQRFTTS